MDIIDLIIKIRGQKESFISVRKKGYYQKLLLLLAFIPCRNLVLEQINLILDYTGTGNQVRKILSQLCSAGFIAKESFLYNDRYATYSLNPAGLQWVVDELSSIMKWDSIIPIEFLQTEYRMHRNQPISNHAICINQVILSFVCAAPAPLNSIWGIEKAFDLGLNRLTKKTMKMPGQIVPDVFFNLNGLGIFIEADTTAVNFNASKGPNEKIDRYLSLYDLNMAANKFTAIHVLFSVQKKWIPQISSTEFTAPELDVLRNPEKLNNAITILRLISSPLSEGTNPITIDDAWIQLKTASQQFDDSLLHSSLIINAATLINCLCRSGFGTESLDHLRKCSTFLYKKVQSIAIQDQQQADTASTIKRRKELFTSVIQHRQRRQSIYYGASISCCSGTRLASSLPFLFPKYFFLDSELKILFQKLGLMAPSAVIEAYTETISIGNSKEDLVNLNNAFVFRNPYGGFCTVCIENISENIGGFLRAEKFLCSDFNPDFFLLMLIEDSLTLADGCPLHSNSNFAIYFNPASLFQDPPCHYVITYSGILELINCSSALPN